MSQRASIVQAKAPKEHCMTDNRVDKEALWSVLKIYGERTVIKGEISERVMKGRSVVGLLARGLRT